MTIRPQMLTFGYGTAIYGISIFFTRIITLILVPVYTNRLSVYEVGIIIFFEMIEALFVSLVPLGSINSMWRYLSSANTVGKKKVIFSTFLINFLCCSVFSIIFFLLIPQLSEIFVYQNIEFLLSLLIASCFLKSISVFIYYMLQYENKTVLYLIFSLVQSLLIFSLTIYFIVCLDLGVAGIYYSKIIVFLILAITTIVYLLKIHLAVPSINYIKKIISYGLPTVPFALLLPILTYSDRIFLDYYLSLEDVGRYGIAFKFGMLVQMFLVVPVDKTFSPNLFKIGIGSEKDLKIHSDIANYYSLIGLLFLFILTLFSKDILLFFTNHSYSSEYWLIPLISLAYYVGGFRVFFKAGPALSDQTHYFAYIGLFTIIINIFLNYLLIKSFGLLGASLSKILSFISLIVMMNYVSKNTVKIKWPIKKTIKGILLMTILLIIYYLITNHISIYDFLFKVIISFSFFVLLFFFRIIEKKEIAKIKNTYNAFINKG